MKSFKKQYKDKINTLRITDIGFEDYYLIHDLVCHKTNTQNPEQYYVREGMRIAYLYATYNDGKLNTLHQEYPRRFVDYLMGFDNIFTANYDSNLESATHKQAYHIHGQFDKKSDVYLLDSFRNQLPDAPIKEIEIDENYGSYQNVFLTTEELSALQIEVPHYQEYIEKLSRYMVSSGKQYANHAAIIRSWALQDHPAPDKRTYECKEDESL